MEETQDKTGLEIAVIGMVGRFPGARDVAELWRNLVGGVESISFFSPEELRAAGRDPALVEDRRYVGARGALAEADLFDAELFGYNPREAEIMDPQQRIFLESAWSALEDAGYDPARYRGLIGVYGGTSTNTYIYNLLSHPELLSALGRTQVGLANERDFLCARVSYKLSLEGPSLNVQTACSTSLVAVHLASQALLGGECDMALAGGVSIIFPQESGYLYQENGILSPDGHCRAFDARARGTVMGNGVGIVVLKRLADALRDGDSIRAVLRGSAINNDGSEKAGFTAPRIDGQAKVICTAQEIAQVEPETITYLEAHGTGTEMGDPIEIAALTQAFRTGTDKRGFCALGTIKTNIGHLDATAGVAGLIKTVLALEHKILPPSLHFEQPNPQIDFAASPFYVSTCAAPWPAGPTPRRAGVSSFGLGGANAHVVLEEAPAPEPAAPARPWQLIVLSARSEAALDAASGNLSAWLAGHPEADLADVAYTLQVGRRELRCRRAAVCRDAGEARRALDRREPASIVSEPGRPAAFLFPGQGAQHAGMGRGLYATEEVFRRAVDDCAGLLAPRLGRDLRDLLFPAEERREEAERLLGETRFAQPALFVVEHALARLWISWGVRPAAMIGHSLGEYVAACLAGVFSLPDALELVVARGEMMQSLPGGAMLSVELPGAELERRCGSGLSLAAFNAPALSVVSGPEPAVEELAARLAGEGISCRRLRTSHAFHSAMMEPIADAFEQRVRSIALASPGIPYLSNVTGTWITAAEVTDPGYWVRHLLAPVRFADGIAGLWRDQGRMILLEVGPGHSLGSFASKQPQGFPAAERAVLASLRHEGDRQSDEELLQKTLGRLWLAGAAVDWSGVHAGERRRHLSLPTYPFERRRFWIERRSEPAAAPPRLPAGKLPDPADWFHLPVWKSAPRPLEARSMVRERWLVLLDEQGVGRELTRRLEAAGQEVVEVRRGDGFARLGDRLFTLDPRQESGVGALLAALDGAPERIVHLWCLGPGVEAADPGSFAPAQVPGFYTLLALAQALGTASGAAPVEICAVVDGALAIERGDVLRPERATLASALQVIPQEYSAIRCRLIDVDFPETGRADQVEPLAARLLTELAQPSPEPVVARRCAQRWIPDFAPVRLDEPAASPLREGGVYLITGGLGGIGLGLAGLLARKVRAKLVLTGRSAVPERSLWPQHLAAGGEWSDRIRHLQALEEAGAEVLALSADVTDEAAMRSVLARCRERFGGLHGVLHTAGLPGSGLIQLKTREMADRVQAPKTVGTLVLERVLDGWPLDFLALFSSAASLFGGIGQVDYTAANAFLDAFAERDAANGRHTVAIDWCEWQWDAWTGSAMPLDGEVRRRLDEQRKTFGLTFEEGFEALCRALASGFPRVAVLTRSFASYQRHSISDVLSGLQSLRPKGEAVRLHSRPSLGAPYVAPRTEVERTLAAIWQELLGIEQVGVEDDFLEMGGHSLLALQAISRIYEALRVDVPLHTLLASPTIAELAMLVAEQRRETPENLDELPAEKAARPARFPLSFAQQRLWFLNQLDPGSVAYHIPIGLSLRGALRREVLSASLQEIVRRHKTLRTTFEDVDQHSVQVISPPPAVAVPLVDLAALPAGLRQREVERLAGELAHLPFDLGRGPLLRVHLLRSGSAESVLLVTIHHIVADGWSAGVFLSELGTLYAAYAGGRPSPLPELPLQYVDFARRQREQLEGKVLEDELRYWKDRLIDGPPALDLPTDRPRPAIRKGRGASLFLSCPKALRDRLAALSQREGATLFMTFLAALSAVLSGHTGQTDICIGTPITGRNRRELQGVIGLFVNILVARTDLSGDPSFRRLLQRVRATALDAYAHQDLPFEMLVKEFQVKRDLGRTPLFQVMIAWQDAPPLSTVELTSLALQPLPITATAAKSDLSLEVRAADLGVYAEYDRDLFDSTTIHRLLGHLENLLEAVAEEPDKTLSALPRLTPAERHQMSVEWSTAPGMPPAIPFIDLFDAQAAGAPERRAQVFAGEALTNGELAGRAGRVARALRRRGVGGGSLVGLFAERSVEMVVGILGIWQAGGAYLPLEPAYPRDRLALMLDDAKPSVVIAQERLLSELPASAAEVLCCEALTGEAADEEERGGEAVRRPEDLAYVIYTSGSTGRPKGVMATQGALASVLAACRQEHGWHAADVMLCLAPFSFDIFLFELCNPLSVGGTAILLPLKPALDLGRLMEILPGLTRLHAVPALMRQIVDAVRRQGAGAERLATLFVGGDAVPLDLLADLREIFPPAEVRVLYGPTEATIICAGHTLAAGGRPVRSLLGRPLPGAEILLCDRWGEPVPIGVQGEIWIGGPGVARGYLGREDLTAERFPLRGRRRFYRTGDMARWLPSGDLEFLGRLDHQVKIRGFRIELGEIEAAIAEHPAVHETVVLAIDEGPGERRLTAFVVPRGEGFAAAGLRDFLAARLPGYMVPVRLLPLAALPLTANGKVDRLALLPLAATLGPLAAAPRERLAPREPREALLAEVWRLTLRTREVGIQDNFFELGGDSILSLQIVSRLAREGWRLTPGQIFEFPTVAELAAKMEPLGRPAAGESEPVTGPVPLTPAQHRFFAQAPVHPEHFNQALLLDIGRATAGERRALRGAVAHLLAHHDALRMRFTPPAAAGELWQQVSSGETEPPFIEIDLAALPAGRRAAERAAAAAGLQGSLDLTAGPLLRAALFTTGTDGGDRLLLVIHHLVVDGVSWRILLEDLESVCRQLAGGGALSLPPKTTSYRRWAEHLAAHGRSATVASQAGYWRAALGGSRRLPIDQDLGPAAVASARTVVVTLDREETQALLAAAPRAYRTQINDLLLTALAGALAPWTGSRQIRVELEGHGREEIAAGFDLARTVGWFTAVFPILLDLERTTEPGTALKRVKETLRGVPDRGIGFDLLRFLGGEPGAALRSLPVPEVVFNYLGQLDAGAAGDGSFRLSGEPAGPSRHPRQVRSHLLEIDGSVSGGRLQVAWTYSADRHLRSTIEALAQRFLVSLRELLAHCTAPEIYGYTPSDFPLAGLAQEPLDRVAAELGRGLADLYPLSPMQQAMLLQTLRGRETGVYVGQLRLDLGAKLDQALFEHAWQMVVDRHPILRTGFLWRDLPAPLQAVRQEVPLSWDRQDWRGLTADEQERRLAAYLEEDRRRGFDLATPPLMRLALIRLGEDAHQFVWSHHHLLIDGWSIQILLREVFAVYESGRAGGAPQLAPLRPYRDYIAWLGEQDLAAAERFWRGELAGFSEPTPLGIDGVTGDERGQGGKETVLPVAATEALRSLARRLELTLNTLVQGAWALLLSRLSGERDVLFGVVTSGRSGSLQGIDEMLGLFINTLPARVEVPPEARLGEWLQELQRRQTAARGHEHSPLPQVQGWSAVEQGRPLFESLLTFENYPVDEAMQKRAGRDLGITGIDDVGQNQFPLNLLAAPRTRLYLKILYARERFESVAIARALENFLHLLAELQGDPERPLCDVPLLSAVERHELLVEWNDRGEGEVLFLHDLVAGWASRTPEAVAVEHAGRRLSYRDLDRRANQLARHLATLGVGRGVPVGICVERSLEMVVGLLGVLKSGGGYLPLDPGYPEERLAFMTSDCGLLVQLTQESLEGVLPQSWGFTVRLDADWERIAEESAEPVFPGLAADDLAYVIYTSGSTGQPKGVMVSHRGLGNLAREQAAQFGVEPGSQVLQFASLSFDASISEIAMALASGATLHLADREALLPGPDLLGLLRERRISTVTLPPAVLAGLPVADLPDLHTLVVAGEACPLDVARRWGRGRRLVNAYGPTEATVCSTSAVFAGEISRLPIGRPIAGAQVYLLDGALQPVPSGVKGELYLGGLGLARGYWERPSLTAAAFVPHPFSVEPGARLYRTRDLGRLLADGEIELLGRADSQVKLRGFRIELGEIEAALVQHPAVRDAVVLLQGGVGGGEPRLVAYVTESAEVPALKAMWGFLAARLPDHMLPSALVVLPALPLTANGKVDRRALPAPGAGQAQRGTPFVAPRTEIERFLAGLWAEVLKVEKVGVDDDFFELGGNSINGAILVNRVQEELRATVHIVAVFDAPTVARLAADLTAQHPGAVARIWSGESAGSENAAAEIPPAGWVDEDKVAMMRQMLRRK